MQKYSRIVCTQSSPASLVDLVVALGVIASVEEGALTEPAAAVAVVVAAAAAAAVEVAAAEIESTVVVIAVAVVPSVTGDEDACGSANELHSLPRN